MKSKDPAEFVMYDVVELCQREGIELRGVEGQPYCCGERMNVKAGLMGPDYAKCLKCGKIIANMASPHVNGGILVSKNWLKKHGNKTWLPWHILGGE